MFWNIFHNILDYFNVFYVVLTPSIHGDFITYASLLGSYGVWTRISSSFIVSMFSKHGTYIKNVEVWGVIPRDLHDVMYMSINHGKTINDFKECG